MKEHRRAVVIGDMNASAIADGINETKGCLLESWHMINHPDRVNREKGYLSLICTSN